MWEILEQILEVAWHCWQTADSVLPNPIVACGKLTHLIGAAPSGRARGSHRQGGLNDREMGTDANAVYDQARLKGGDGLELQGAEDTCGQNLVPTVTTA